MNYGMLFALVFAVLWIIALVAVVKNVPEKGSYESLSRGAGIVWLVITALIAAAALPFASVGVEALTIRNAAMRDEGVPDVRLAVTGARALETLSESVSLNIDWSNSENLPDDVIRQLAENQSELLTILREQSR